MTPADKEKFIRSLCDSIRDEVIKRIQYMPDAWDGIELREYLARLFEGERYLGRNPRPDKRRLRDYRNTVGTTFGL
jgi:hypothetical protein